MGNNDERRGPGNRPSTPGISTPPSGDLSKQLHDARAKTLELERRLQDLEHTVNDKNQWNNLVRGWVGSKIVVRLQDNVEIHGLLRMLDRYTLHVIGTAYRGSEHEGPVIVSAGTEVDIVVHKGSISFICKQP